jgi:hypothetical protein
MAGGVDDDQVGSQSAPGYMDIGKPGYSIVGNL